MVVAQDDPAVISPRHTSNVSGPKRLELAIDLGDRFVSERFRGRQQDCGRAWTVLGLAEQIGGAHFGIDAVVGQQKGLCRPGRKIDPDPAEKQSLRFSNKGVSRADEHIDWVHHDP